MFVRKLGINWPTRCALALAIIIVGAGLSAAPATAATPTSACMNQWLFNGVWRVKVTKVEPVMDGGHQTGWRIAETWRNGTPQAVAPDQTYLQPQLLTLDDGMKISTADSNTSSMSNENIGSHELPPAGQFNQEELFLHPKLAVDPNTKLKTVDVSFDAAKTAQNKNVPHFSTSQPAMHFKLDCVATAAVAAASAGGAYEIRAKDGCKNQWMSNGIWRMRVTGIAPDMDNGTQLGWAVTEQWMNVAKRATTPFDTNVGDQQLALASGETISSTNSAGSSMSQQALTFHQFPRGGAFTYTQLFRQGALDLTDLPAKVIVTFNIKPQNANPNAPHYTSNPANFRIRLSCGH